MQPALELPNVDIASFLRPATAAVVDFFPTLVVWVKNTMGTLVGISIPLSLFFLIVIIYCVEQLKRIRSKEEEMYDLKAVPAYEKTGNGEPEMAKRWESVKQHMSSKNENDWRRAVIDADIILDDLLTKMGYQGDTVGEKLQRVAKGDFATLNDAWEAHKVRNQIAHEGSNFSLNEHDAKKAVDSYRRVFEEFYYF